MVLWLIALGLAIYGVVTIVRGAVVTGILLLVLAALIGPGGVSIFNL